MTTIADHPTVNVTGLRHAAVRCGDLRRSRVFYAERLGFPLVADGDAGFTFAAGASLVQVLAPLAGGDAAPVTGTGPGVCRLALGCPDGAELRRAAAALTRGGIAHSDVRIDGASGKEYLTFDDPDGIGWELYVV